MCAARLTSNVYRLTITSPSYLLFLYINLCLSYPHGKNATSFLGDSLVTPGWDEGITSEI